MSETEDTDLEALLVGIARGENKAMEAFYDSTVNRVFSLCLRITREESLAEEVVCDTYLQVWQHANDYDRARGDVIAWLMVLTRSRALDQLRRNKHYQYQESIDSDEQVIDEISPETLLAAMDKDNIMHKLVAELEETQRQLVALAFFRGYSHSEMAEFTGLPLGTIKSRLRRAMQTLREKLIQNGLYGENDV